MINKKIGYIPFDNVGNSYTERMIEILSRFGTVSKVPSIKDVFNDFSLFCFNKFDIVFANWIENCIIDSAGGISIKGVLKFAARVFFIKMIAKRSVFVRHNNYPHGLLKKNAYLATKIIDAFEWFFDSVVIHSGHNAKSGRVYVPHPLYKGSDSLNQSRFCEEDYFLVFGRILPYKKIENLINVLSSKIKVVIAGGAPDKEYVEFLKKISLDKNVVIVPRFIPEHEAVGLAKKSLGIVVVHNDDDMIVSGTFFFAVSLGVPIFTVASPFVNWINSEHKLAGIYVSESIQDISNEMERRYGKDENIELPSEIEVDKLFGDEEVFNKLTYLMDIR